MSCLSEGSSRMRTLVSKFSCCILYNSVVRLGRYSSCLLTDKRGLNGGLEISKPSLFLSYGVSCLAMLLGLSDFVYSIMMGDRWVVGLTNLVK